MDKQQVSIFWFRRDLRLDDNAGLYHALKSGHPLQLVFIFDTNILDELEDPCDQRVVFIHRSLEVMQERLTALGATLDVRFGKPEKVFEELKKDYNIAAVFLNHDYEPYARQRDNAIYLLFKKENIEVTGFKDQVIFEKKEIVKDDGQPYHVFTPYYRKWMSCLSDFYLKSYPCKTYFKYFHKQQPLPIPTLKKMGFQAANAGFPSKSASADLIKNYDKTRDLPAVRGTTRLGVHLRFGTISVRKLATQAKELNAVYLKELVWREFYQMILFHHPHIVTQSFKKEYDAIQWRNNEKDFDAWCKGETGYPIVDAGMRELNETGFMHNRVRMITASFLTKHLLIDWRWGEAYFAKKLLDYDLASNNGGWQWAAGSGCDAAPYFRIFNPYLQTKKFDPELKYIKKWVPEVESNNYRAPIVAHELARERCLATFKKALKNK
ncbi:cryptochrome/photolyase family protein [Niabella insulamsoli]|uniref:cryptochrome/photolyase family protein n=1 Tax=Niabella insulamsoli TaxID=3144874 RepID=UPI0031FCC887